MDFDATMLKAHSTTPITSRSTCLSQTMHSYFMKIAGKEYHDPAKFANLYGGAFVLSLGWWIPAINHVSLFINHRDFFIMWFVYSLSLLVGIAKGPFFDKLSDHILVF